MMRRVADLRDESGSFVLFALVLPMLIIMTSFAVDVAGIYVHRRHLQMQADAAALAGGGHLQVDGCDNAAIQAAADDYAGLTSSTYNTPKIPEEADRISRTYAHPPCDPPEGQARAVDIKVTETDIPLHFALGLTDADVSARARVELLQITAQSGSLPIALEEDKIKSVSLTLYDESLTPETDPLAQTRTLGMVGGSDNGTTVTWGNDDTPFTRDVTEPNLALRATIERATGTSSYDLGSASGILHIHGFEQVPPVESEAPPALERVNLTPAAGCAADNGYFVSGGCSVHVEARVDFVDGINLTGSAQGAFVTAHMGGDSEVLTYNATTGFWEADLTPTGDGPKALTLDWRQEAGKISATTSCGTNTGSVKVPKCYGVFKGTQAAGVYTGTSQNSTSGQATKVHSTFVASQARTDDIAFARVAENGAVANSVDRCGASVATCGHSFTVYLGLPSPLQLGSHRVLTVAEPGSNDGHLNCDPDSAGGAKGFEDMLATGCKPMYEINEGEPCKPAQDFGVGWGEQPWSCVPSASGDMTSTIGPGIDRRVYGTTSPTLLQCVENRNRWPDWEAGETRIVRVMLVRPAELDAQGRKVFPIKDFAYFYVTGWSHAGNKEACPITDSLNEPVAKNGIAGYFIKYAVANDGSVVGEGECKDEAIGGCVPVLTE